MSTMPARIDGELFEAAKSAGAVHSRSAAQQLNHWARIGRELESAGATTREIERVLAGDISYDALPDRDQAVVRAEWDERLDTMTRELDLAIEFTEAGESWSEADAQGNVVSRD